MMSSNFLNTLYIVSMIKPRDSRTDRAESANEPLQFLTLNVCGLKSRIIYPEFSNILSKYDFIGLQETKTDSLDDIHIPGYNIHFKHRKNIARKKIRWCGISLQDKV